MEKANFESELVCSVFHTTVSNKVYEILNHFYKIHFGQNYFLQLKMKESVLSMLKVRCAELWYLVGEAY